MRFAVWLGSDAGSVGGTDAKCALLFGWGAMPEVLEGRTPNALCCLAVYRAPDANALRCLLFFVFEENGHIALCKFA